MLTRQNNAPDYSQPLEIDTDKLIADSRRIWRWRRLTGFALLLACLPFALAGGWWAIPACALAFIGGRRLISTFY
jgi:hypothetical protein